MSDQVSVSQLVNSIKNLLEGEFRFIKVEGEISNFNSSSAGHIYFTLSDKDSSISCALFRGDALRNPEVKKIKDGDKVLIVGGLGVYSKRGTFQVIVKTITKSGKGDLLAQFELLKKKLAREGLFDIDIKQKIPKLPKKVAVITAESGAALQDFINVFKRRSLWMEVMVVPSVVQGEAAPKSLVNALQSVIKYSMQAPESKKIDVIVLTRGGGSLEDLWAFNNEALAWEIYQCPIPVVSAVGHQVDYSISDFVADLRCETPTAAAEILTGEQVKIIEKMNHLKKHLYSEARDFIQKNKVRLNNAHPSANLDRIWGLFNNFQKRLTRCDIRRRLGELTNLHEKQLLVDDLFQRLTNVVNDQINQLGNRVERSGYLLGALGPYQVLARGYTFVTTEDGKVVASYKSFKKIDQDKDLLLHFSDGHGKVRKN